MFAVQRIPGSVLRSGTPTAALVRIVVLDDRRFPLDDLLFGARARQRRAQKDVDDEHDQEEDSEGDTQAQQPRPPMDGTVL